MSTLPQFSPTLDAAGLRPTSEFEGSLAQKVYASLKHAILSLNAPPGAVLRKPEICAALGVSRSPVSEAIARLSAERLVDVTPQSGSSVAYFSLAEIREAAFVRAALELASVERVARDRDAEQLAQLARNLRLQQLCAEDGDLTGFYEADDAFHGLIMGFTGFSSVAATARSSSLQLTRARMFLLPAKGRMSETLAEHRAVFDAIEASDPVGARAAMAAHLDRLEDMLLPQLEQHPELFQQPAGR